MIDVQIKFNFKAPEFTHQEDLLEIAEKIFIPKMNQGIESGVDLLGAPFPPNDPKTVKAKGHSRVLIGKEGKLRRAIYAYGKGKSAVVITLQSDRKDIGGYLQNDGIKSNAGRKFFNFFGINQEMEQLALNFMRQRIGELINAA